jgi:hypothetical protein
MYIQIKLIETNEAEEAQNTPCAFGTFCIVYKDKVSSCHPVSSTRFKNIMKANNGF